MGLGPTCILSKDSCLTRPKRTPRRPKAQLVKRARGNKSRVHLDTIISPSYTSAIAQCIQLPGISGKGNNLFLMEYAPDHPANRDQLLDNFTLLVAAGLDLALLRSSGRKFGNKHDIHLWINPEDASNSSLMILLAYILQGIPNGRRRASACSFCMTVRTPKKKEPCGQASLRADCPLRSKISSTSPTSPVLCKPSRTNQGSGPCHLGIHPTRHRNHRRRCL